VPNWVFLLVRLFFGVAGSAAMTWAGWKLGGREWALVAGVFSTPLIGVAIARPLVEVIHEGLGWLSDQPLREWQGNYYYFGSVQVRVFEEAGSLWFAAKDVIHATGIQANAETILDGRELEGGKLRCLSMTEVEALLTSHGGHEASRFVLWAQREVIAPWERKRR
jgi:hypothetical protein